jgi:hypothetical protein
MDRLPFAGRHRNERDENAGDAAGDRRSSHGANATIRAMMPGGALLIALLLQSPPPGAAAAAPPDVAKTEARLDLRGAADCISRADVAARVAARTPRVQFVDDAAILARVAITSTHPGNVIAEVGLATPGAEQPSRKLVARSCAEAADAVALIIAITLDPTLKPTYQPPEPPPPAPLAVVESPAPPAPVPPSGTRRHFGVSVAGQTIFGPAPAVMPGVALYGMLALDRDSVWAPALFIGGTHVWRNDLEQTDGKASFTLDAASVDACPLRVGRSGFVARPCASALVGRLNARGTDTTNGTSEARPFATAGLTLSAIAPLPANVELSARFGIGMTLLRDAYELGSTTFHRAGRITVAASVGAGVRWP